MSEFLNGFKRTHTCGALRGSDIGKTVRLVGWVQDYRNLGSFLFIVLRDRYGVTQIHIDAASPLFEQAQKIRAEWCIGVEGEVISRGKDANKKLATGEIEVEAKELRVFNRAETTPFAIHDKCDADEKIRLKYRYLDLRRPCLNYNIITRSKVTGIIRRVLESKDFLDLETPILGKSISRISLKIVQIISSQMLCISSGSIKLISMSICVNSGWRSSRKSSSRKHRAIW